VQLDLSHSLAFSMETHWQSPIFTNAKLLFYKENQLVIKLSLWRSNIIWIIKH